MPLPTRFAAARLCACSATARLLRSCVNCHIGVGGSASKLDMHQSVRELPFHSKPDTHQTQDVCQSTTMFCHSPQQHPKNILSNMMAFYTCTCHMAASSAAHVVASAPNVLLTLSVWARAAEHTILQRCALANTYAQRPPTTMQHRKTPLCNR